MTPLITRPLWATLLSVAVSAGFSTTTLAADQTATADDGREVVLKSDGSWQYLSTDRYATSEAGTRVRLKDDGSWEFIGNAPVATQEQVRTESLEVKLGDIIAESKREKAGKNTRLQSATIFNLTIEVSEYSQGLDATLSAYDLFKVTDSRGNEYPVTDITPPLKHLEPGKSYQLAVRADGTTAGQFAVGIKYIYLEIDKSVFSSDANLKFSRRADEAKKVEL